MSTNRDAAELDELCDQFEQEFRSDISPEIQSYLQRVPNALRRTLLRELLLVELELVPESEWDGRWERYRQEFAGYADVLDEFRSSHDTRCGGLPREHPQQIGPFKILQTIGEGGMGAVFMAEQQRPVQRRVALKVIRVGLDSKQVIARFEAERQSLAIMEHPSIARMLDAGTTETGRPYFAMELVKGLPLTEYCDRHRLPVAERLQIFQQVCDAVHHAHQKGIIHRDLKPSNILVAEYNGRPIPKVIDFGLAKALETTHKLTDKTIFTEFGQVVGTVKYMSPEQAGLDSLDIDTRTDIYSLGVILYELLTGTTPLDEDTIRGKAMLKLLAMVREQEAPRPSSRLTTSKQTLSKVTEQRGIEPRKLTQMLSGDLDWIVMKSIEKDRNRRYASAAGLSTDVRRYLDNQAVSARPPTVAYVVRKFMAKNRGLVASLVSLGATLMVGIVGSTWFAIEAGRARQAAVIAQALAETNEEAALDSRRQALDAVDEFFTTVSQEELLDTPGMQPLREKLLGKATQFYEAMVTDEDLHSSAVTIVEAKTRYASMTHKLGNVDRAIDILQEGLQLLRQQGSPPPQLTDTRLETIILLRLGDYLRGLGQLEQARDYLAEASRIAKASHDRDKSPASALTYADVLIGCAEVEKVAGNSSKAFEFVDQARVLLEKDNTEGPTRRERMDSHAHALTLLADLVPDEAAASFRDQSIEIRRQLRAAEPGGLRNSLLLGRALTNKAFADFRTSPFSAFELFEEAAGYLEVLHDRNPTVTSYRHALANALDLHAFSKHQTGSIVTIETRDRYFRESLDLYRRAAETLRVEFKNDQSRNVDFSQVAPSDLSLLAMIFNGQALVNRDLENQQAAMNGFQNALLIQRKLADNSPDAFRPKLDLCGTTRNMALTLARFGEYETAIEYHKEAVRGVKRLAGEFPDERTLAMHRVDFMIASNTTVLESRDAELVRDHFMDVRQACDAAAIQSGNPLAVRKQQARLQLAIRQLLDGDMTSYAELHTEVLENAGSLTVSLQTARQLASLQQTLAKQTSADPEDQTQIIRWAGEILEQVVQDGLMTKADILTESELNYIHQQVDNVSTVTATGEEPAN